MREASCGNMLPAIIVYYLFIIYLFILYHLVSARQHA
jgi:hypothetical protein